MGSLNSRSFRCFYHLLAVVTVACATNAVAAPQQSPPSAVTARIANAKKIFLSNAGANAEFAGHMTGGANGSYDELYASLKQWGYFQLVDSPAKADLVFEIRSKETQVSKKLKDVGPPSPSYYHYYVFGTPQSAFNLTILDPTTDSKLWTTVSPAGYADSAKKSKVAFSRSILTLTNQIKTLVGVPATIPASTEDQPASEPQTIADAPVPPEVRTAKTVYVRNDGANGDMYNRFVAALSAWSYYTLVDAPEKANLIFDLRDSQFESDLAVTVVQRSSNVTLWAVSDPLYDAYPLSKEKLKSRKIQDLVSGLKQMDGVPLTAAEGSSLR
jgi:hypothetical protein